MQKPVLFVLDDSPLDLAATQDQLRARYGRDDDVLAEVSAAAALRQLEDLRQAGTPVIAVFASGSESFEVLDNVRDLHPEAKRVLLIPKGNRSATKPILRAITLGRIDRYATKPVRTPDERFHALVSEILAEWQRKREPDPAAVTIVGQRWEARAYELRDYMQRSGLPFVFHDAESDEGREAIARAGHDDPSLPLLIRYDGLTLERPTNEQVAVALGARHSIEEGTFDLAVIGAGPAGLCAAVYGGSEGLRTIVVDRETIGGQAGTTSLIRNYLGFPFGISGAELTNRALDQAWSFGVETSVVRQATGIRTSGTERTLTFADGSTIVSRAVLIATGALYQRLDVPELEAFVGSGVYYGGGVTEALLHAGLHVYVAGAGNSAGQAAVHLARHAARVTMLVRGGDLGARMSDYLVKEIEALENIDVRFRTEVVGGAGVGRLEQLVLRHTITHEHETVPATALFVLIGAQPNTAWLPPSILRDRQGFLLTGGDAATAEGFADVWPLKRPPLQFETSMPGVFAAGDVRHGSVKRVASAVGEGGVAIQSVHQYLAQLRRSGP